MNRLVVFGVAIFFAIVGIALLGGEKKAAAGHKCNGCSCDCGGDNGCNSCDCGGRKRRHRRKNRCGGCHADDCCGAPACCEPACAPACAPACEPACAPAPACCGEVVHEHAPAPAPAPEPAADEGAAPPPPPGAGTSIERGPMVYRQVSFRR